MVHRAKPDDLDRTSGDSSTDREQKAAELMQRYPDLSESELAQLIANFRELSPVELAMMASKEELTPHLEQFRREQKSKIRTPFRQYAVLVVIAVAGIAMIAYAVLLAM